MVFKGQIDDFDGLVIRRRFDADMYEVRAYRTVGEGYNMKLDGQVAVSFSPSILVQMAEVEAAIGKRLRITVEVIP